MPFSKKWITEGEFLLTNTGDVSVTPIGENDLTGIIRNSAAIRYRQEYQGIIKERRRFPKGNGTSSTGWRALVKQVGIAPALVITQSSDVDGAGNTVTVIGSTITLNTGSYDWLLDVVGQTIYLDVDGYVTGYPVVTRTSADDIQVTGTPPAGSPYKWILKGYPTTEVVELQAITVWPAPLATDVGPPGSTGGNS
jgi:hypothetical protein